MLPEDTCLNEDALEGTIEDCGTFTTPHSPFSMFSLFCPRCGLLLFPPSLPFAGYDLRCMNGHEWPIRDGVAVLIPPDLDDGTLETVETFRFKWARDIAAMREERTRIANAWFNRRFGFAETGTRERSTLFTFLKRRRRILDAGCGLGNLTTLLARLAPHATVWGVDLSTAVHSVQRAPNIKLVQGDITRLPIAGEFDLIVSDGVLHHTPDTKTSMLALAKRLAPGGDFLFYVYKKKAPVREFTDDYLRAIISNMEPEAAMKTCAAIADLGRQLREAGVTIHVENAIPELGIPAGDHDLHRFVYWHFFKAFWDDGGNEVASVLENFDWYHPRYAWRHDRHEVESWVAEAGLKVVRFDDSESGFAVHAHREG